MPRKGKMQIGQRWLKPLGANSFKPWELSPMAL